MPTPLDANPSATDTDAGDATSPATAAPPQPIDAVAQEHLGLRTTCACCPTALSLMPRTTGAATWPQSALALLDASARRGRGEPDPGRRAARLLIEAGRHDEAVAAARARAGTQGVVAGAGASGAGAAQRSAPSTRRRAWPRRCWPRPPRRCTPLYISRLVALARQDRSRRRAPLSSACCGCTRTAPRVARVGPRCTGRGRRGHGARPGRPSARRLCRGAARPGARTTALRRARWAPIESAARARAAPRRR